MRVERTQAAVIGAGPAGTTLATKLARQGIQVTLFERERFPRFHIGESLLPASLPIFDDLGILEPLEAIALRKPGGCWYYGDKPVYSDFSDCRASASFADFGHAFMVERSSFDQLMVKNAVRHGADARHGHAVKHARIENDRVVELEINDGTTGTRYRVRPEVVFDCSGYHSFIARQLGLRKVNGLKRMALFAHHALDEESLDARVRDNWFVGEMLHDGWLWLIPLPEGKLSIGLVTHLDHCTTLGRAKDAYFDAILSRSKLVQRAFAKLPRRLSPVHLYGNLGYSSSRFFGTNWALAGDAAFFIDPCYSTGVHSALETGSDIAHRYLQMRAEADPAPFSSAMAPIAKKLRRHERILTQLVQCFYIASTHRLMRWAVPRLNSLRPIYRDFVAITGGDFQTSPASVRLGWLLHKAVSLLWPADRAPSSDSPIPLARSLSSVEREDRGGTKPLAEHMRGTRPAGNLVVYE